MVEAFSKKVRIWSLGVTGMSNQPEINLLKYKLTLILTILIGINSCETHSGVRVDSVGSAPLDSQAHIQLHYIKFHKDGLNHIILWRGNPKQQTIINKDNYLQAINGKKIKFLKITKQVNILKNDYTVAGIDIPDLPYNVDINFYKSESIVSKTQLIK